MLQCVGASYVVAQVCYSLLQFVAVHCSVLQCVAVRFGALQRDAVWCSVLTLRTLLHRCVIVCTGTL